MRGLVYTPKLELEEILLVLCECVKIVFGLNNKGKRRTNTSTSFKEENKKTKLVLSYCKAGWN